MVMEIGLFDGEAIPEDMKREFPDQEISIMESVEDR